MSLLRTLLRKIRACEGEAAAQVVFEHYVMLERNKVLDAAVEAVDQMYKDIVFNQDHVYRCLLARCRTKKDAIEAINKLRRD